MSQNSKSAAKRKNNQSFWKKKIASIIGEKDDVHLVFSCATKLAFVLNINLVPSDNVHIVWK